MSKNVSKIEVRVFGRLCLEVTTAKAESPSVKSLAQSINITCPSSSDGAAKQILQELTSKLELLAKSQAGKEF